MTQEIIYLSHDNVNQLILRASGIPEDLSVVTKITATFNDVLIESTDKAAGIITWDQIGYLVGEIRLGLGGQAIPSGTYDKVYIIAYDAVNTTGIVWESFPAEVMAEVEAAP